MQKDNRLKDHLKFPIFSIILSKFQHSKYPVIKYEELPEFAL